MDKHQMFVMVFIFIFFFFLIDFAVPLRVNSIDATAKKNTLCLKCQYTLEPNERLSAIQWYRNSNPFYYYTNGVNDNRGSRPLDLHYSSDGFEVNAKKSTDKAVYLDHISPKDSGMYACEVTVGMPTFQSKTAQRNVNIFRTRKTH